MLDIEEIASLFFPMLCIKHCNVCCLFAVILTVTPHAIPSQLTLCSYPTYYTLPTAPVQLPHILYSPNCPCAVTPHTILPQLPLCSYPTYYTPLTAPVQLPHIL